MPHSMRRTYSCKWKRIGYKSQHTYANKIRIKRTEEYLALSDYMVVGTKYMIIFLTDNSTESNNKCRLMMMNGISRNSMAKFAFAPVVTAGLCTA